MPLVKAISGHNGCRQIQEYLEGKDGERAVAQDFINLCAENGPGHEPWWKWMDRTRAAAGNDARVVRGGKSRAALCYRHYVISPDPRDHVDLATLRELVVTWCEEHFGDYEVAITYHDDNDAGIPHAHVVINNTNLVTGKRWSTEFKKRDVQRINNSLQNLALERGLSAFTADHRSMNEREMRESGRNVSTLGGRDARWRDHRESAAERRPFGKVVRPPRPATARRDRRRVVSVDGMARSGRWSWVAETADLVGVARRVSRDEGEFIRTLRELGVEVRESAHGRDWVYTHPGSGGRGVRGSRLGAAYTRQDIRRGFALDYVGWIQRVTVPERGGGGSGLGVEQRRLLVEAVRVYGRSTTSGTYSAAQIASLIDYNAEHSIRGLGDYGRGPRASEMARMAKGLGIFDEELMRREQRRLESDVKTVADWLVEERAARGEGGSHWSQEAVGSADEQLHSLGHGRERDDIER